MYLHENKDSFEQAIRLVSSETKIDEATIEKDYFVTMFLKCLVSKIPTLLFKGGTSLSKCYHIINRFSEDIDISTTLTHLTDSEKKKYKREIIETSKQLGLSITNLYETHSGHDYNRYEIDYNPEYVSHSIAPLLIVETSFRVKTYPYVMLEATSYIGEYYASNGRRDIIEKYELEPFTICVQSLERTLIDKIFAICDHYLSNTISAYSRYIYDIYKIIPYVNLNDDFKKLFNDVRMELIANDKRSIASDRKYDINVILKEIIDKSVYRGDYTNPRQILIYDQTPYEECIKGLQTLIKSNVLR